MNIPTSRRSIAHHLSASGPNSLLPYPFGLPPIFQIRGTLNNTEFSHCFPEALHENKEPFPPVAPQPASQHIS